MFIGKFEISGLGIDLADQHRGKACKKEESSQLSHKSNVHWPMSRQIKNIAVSKFYPCRNQTRNAAGLRALEYP